MTQPSQNIQFDRSEMFAIGAAAGALVTAAISEYLERRRPKTPWEKAQARGAEALSSLSGTAKVGSQRAKEYVDAASDYVQEVIDTTPKSWQKTKKRGKKQRKQSQALGLKEAAVAALGVSAATGVVDKVRDYASITAERVVGDPYAVSGSIKETLKERFGSSSSSNGHLTDKIQDASGSAFETLKSVAVTAADTVKDYASTARETLKEAELGDKLKDYATVAGSTVATYSTEATKATRRAAKQSASKVSESASYLADATSEQATHLRKGARKSVTRTRRRVRWGLRAFIIGLAIGLLAAPQSGQRTRDAVTSFIESLLDVIMPDSQS